MTRARLLLHVAATHKGKYALWFALTLLVELLPLLSGIVLQELFDALPVAESFQPLLLLVALFGTVPIARLLMIRLELWVEISLTYARSAAMREDVVRRILRRPGAAALSVSPGDAISRLSDDVDEVMGFLAFLPAAVGILAFSLASTWILVQVDARVALAVVIPLLLCVTAVKWAERRIHRYRRVSREKAGRAAGFITELLSSVQAIQLMRAEKRVVDRLDALNEERRTAGVRETLLVSLLDSVFLNTVHIAIGVVILMSAEGMRTGSFTVGDLALFEFYLWFIRLLPGTIGRLLTKYAQVGISIARLQELAGELPGATDDEPARAKASAPPNPSTNPLTGPAADPPTYSPTDPLRRLEVVGLQATHGNTVTALADVSFAIEAGTLTVITGDIGSGKTTLVRVLLGLLPKDAGQILWNGVPIADPAAFFTPPRAAYVPQVPHLVSASVEDNILLGDEAHRAELTRAIADARLADDLAQLQDGLATPVGPKGTRLSGGQVLRVATARALIRQPQLLVLDDVSSALDDETEQALWRRVLRPSVTAIAVSHRPALIDRADQVIHMEAGRARVVLNAAAARRSATARAGGG